MLDCECFYLRMTTFGFLILAAYISVEAITITNKVYWREFYSSLVVKTETEVFEKGPGFNSILPHTNNEYLAICNRSSIRI